MRDLTVTIDQLWHASAGLCIVVLVVHFFVVFLLFRIYILVLYCYNQWSLLQHVCSPHPTRVLCFEARLPKQLMAIRVISAGLRSFHHVLFPFLGLRPHRPNAHHLCCDFLYICWTLVTECNPQYPNSTFIEGRLLTGNWNVCTGEAESLICYPWLQTQFIWHSIHFEKDLYILVVLMPLF